MGWAQANAKFWLAEDWTPQPITVARVTRPVDWLYPSISQLGYCWHFGKIDLHSVRLSHSTPGSPNTKCYYTLHPHTYHFPVWSGGEPILLCLKTIPLHLLGKTFGAEAHPTKAERLLHSKERCSGFGEKTTKATTYWWKMGTEKTLITTPFCLLCHLSFL